MLFLNGLHSSLVTDHQKGRKIGRWLGSRKNVSEWVRLGRQPVPMIGAWRLQSAEKDIAGDMSIWASPNRFVHSHLSQLLGYSGSPFIASWHPVTETMSEWRGTEDCVHLQDGWLPDHCHGHHRSSEWVRVSKVSQCATQVITWRHLTTSNSCPPNPLLVHLCWVDQEISTAAANVSHLLESPLIMLTL